MLAGTVSKKDESPARLLTETSGIIEHRGQREKSRQDEKRKEVKDVVLQSFVLHVRMTSSVICFAKPSIIDTCQ